MLPRRPQTGRSRTFSTASANIRLAVGLTAVALILALPVVNFGVISTRSQIVRLQSGRIEPNAFDWKALATEYGPAGRRALERIAREGTPDQQPAARYALNPQAIALEPRRARPQRITLRPDGAVLPPPLLRYFRTDKLYTGYACDLRLAGNGIAVFRYQTLTDYAVRTDVLAQHETGVWATITSDTDCADNSAAATGDRSTLEGRMVEVRHLTRRQVYLDGKPVGEPFE